MVVVLSHPMKTARPKEEKSLLLFCPEQGGWNRGVWHEGRWLDFPSLSYDLTDYATAWAPMPPDPAGS